MEYLKAQEIIDNRTDNEVLNSIYNELDISEIGYIRVPKQQSLPIRILMQVGKMADDRVKDMGKSEKKSSLIENFKNAAKNASKTIFDN